MAEYIEREALHNSGYDVYDKYAHKSKSARDALLKMEELIKSAPTADVVEVRHSEWVYDHWCEFKCSVCGHFSKTEPRGKENYCPNCGAKMDGKGEGE